MFFPDHIMKTRKVCYCKDLFDDYDENQNFHGDNERLWRQGWPKDGGINNPVWRSGFWRKNNPLWRRL